jgi:hypothetical protein
VVFFGDSTSYIINLDPMLHRLGLACAGRFGPYTVQHNAWDNTSQDYTTQTTVLDAGESAPVLRLWDHCWGGYDTGDVRADFTTAIEGVTTTPALVIMSHGYNEEDLGENVGTPDDADDFDVQRESYEDAIGLIRSEWPGVPIVLVAQMRALPADDNGGEQTTRRTYILDIAANLANCEVIDAWQAFGGNSPKASMYADTQHPTNEGYVYLFQRFAAALV